MVLCVQMASVMLAGAVNVVRTGNIQEPETMDPAEAWIDTASIYIENIFNTLVDVDPDSLKIRPSLAKSWYSNKEGTVWDFKLRRGVKFHDGTDFDADAVVFTFKRQMEEQFKYGEFVLFKEIFPFLKEVKKTGKFEVRFILKEPFFPFPASLSAGCASIVSPSALEERKENFRLNPVGTGPYKLKKWVAGKMIVLESFKDYWMGKPGIGKYVSVIEPSIDKLFEMFRKQEIDILMSFSISKLVVFRGYDWVDYAYSPSLSTAYIAFNMHNRYLKRINVRKAINHLWNKDILKLVYQNHVQPLCSLFPKGISGYDCDMDKYPLSFETARELLKKEGLEKGFELRFLTVRESDLELPTVHRFAANLKKAGIKIRIINVGYDEYVKKISAGDYDLAFAEWVADYPDPFSIISPLFSEKIQEQGLANFSSTDNSDIIALIREARSIKDPAVRERFYLKLNNMVVDRALMVPLHQRINLIIYNKRIGKLKHSRLGMIDLFLLGKQ